MSQADTSLGREELEARATDLGIAFRANWRDETLAEKINEAEAALLAEGAADDLDPDHSDMVKVTGPKKGRWRAGRHFTRTPVILFRSGLTEEQLAAIDADPKLTVETPRAAT